MTIEEYIQKISNKKIVVIGIGISNTPLLKMLLRSGADVLACDKRSKAELGGICEELVSLGAKLKLGPDYLDDLDADLIFRTPGLHPLDPALLRAKDRGAEITSEMEVFFQLCPCTIIGVTGSDGKTTTTTLIAEFLKAAGKDPYVGGNIGKPLLTAVSSMQKEDYAVVELSSFQLMTMKKSPQIAVVTNVAPNHLDMHKSMAEYVSAKENIYLYQSESDRLVLNMDNEITRAFSENARAEISFFSRTQVPERGVYSKDGAIYRRKDGNEIKILEENEILLPGSHNVENYMAAIAAVDGLVDDSVIHTVAGSFSGVPHRIELVRKKSGVSYYNDSIASSPTRTIAGLNAFSQKVILIAGGYDKNLPYEALGPEIAAHVKKLFLTGATGSKIKSAVLNAADADGPEIFEFDDFFDAVYAACNAAEEGDVVLFSPASASFDRFKNFEQRGEAFKRVVYELS